jgi:hypothetical protein|tara:strand:- start:1923 stop:2609 length:687 start_codon:yes stop_codon:yes gene_type:complete
VYIKTAPLEKPMRNLISETAEKVSDNIVSMKYSDNIPPEKKVSDLVSIDWKNVLPEPPENNSQITREEIQEVSELSDKRTDRQVELVMVVDKDIRVMFERLLKDNNLSYPAEKIKKIYNTIVFPVIMNLKWRYNRPRPYQLSPKFGVEIDYIPTDTINTPSYPSGHTAYATIIASVLSEMYPEFSSEFYELVNVAGKAREIQGVHYESDNDASMVIVGALWQDIKYDI